MGLVACFSHGGMCLLWMRLSSQLPVPRACSRDSPMLSSGVDCRSMCALRGTSLAIEPGKVVAPPGLDSASEYFLAGTQSIV